MPNQIISTAKGQAPSSPVIVDQRFELSPFTPVIGERRHDVQYLLLWQAEGETDVLIEERPILLTAGHALWIPRFQRHSFTVAKNSVVLPLFFPIITVSRPIDHPALITVDAGLERLLLAVVAGYYSILTRPEDLSARIVSLIHDQLAAPEGLPLPHSPEISRIAQTLILDPSDPRTLAQWAEEVHLSDRALKNAFVRETGLSWNDWRLTCRMLRAGHMLTGSARDIPAIARAVGYQTHSSFTRAFRRHFGTTPRAYASP